MFERIHIQSLRKRLAEPRKFIQVLVGPRQVGKTTLVTQLTDQLKGGFLFVSADAVTAAGAAWVEQQWDLARLQMKREDRASFLLIIDEIQKVDNWSEVIKKCWDADTRNKLDLKLIILGSSRLLIQQGLTESLAGRFEITYMGHWSFAEMEKAFGWNPDQYVWFGGYPGSADLINDERRWKDYIRHALIETSISKDILMLTRIDKPALMKNLFELGCQYSGQILSFTKIMGQLADAGNTTTLSHYLSLLDTAGLLAGLEKYAKDIIRKRSSSPKFQVHNTALISGQRTETFQDILNDHETWGRLVESAVGAHLLNYAHQEDMSLHYWRERNDEMDFVITQKGKTIGIEVKSSVTRSASGMSAFQQKYNPHKVILVGNDGIPWQEFLKLDPNDLF